MTLISNFVRRANHLLRVSKRIRTPGLVVLAVSMFLAARAPFLKEGKTAQELEAQTVDYRFGFRRWLGHQEWFTKHFGSWVRPEFGHPDVALVGITQMSIDQTALGRFKEDRVQEKYRPAIDLMAKGQWPYPRETYAYVIDRLFELGARVVAVDILFPSNRDGDDAFAEALRRHPGKVVLARTKVEETRDDGGDPKVKIVEPNSQLMEALGPEGVGYVYFKPDVDNTTRRTEMRTSQLRESDLAALSTEEDWVRFAPLAVSKFNGREVPGKEVPANEKPVRWLINYQGGAGTFHTFPIEEIFSERLMSEEPSYQGGKVFQNKIVFVGPIAETMHDQHPTPLGVMPGVEIHAQFAAALVADKHLAEMAERWVPWILAGMALLAFGLLYHVERVLLRIALGASVLGAYLIVANAFFWFPRIVIPVAVPVLLFVCMMGVVTALDFTVEQLERAHVRSVLDKYVSSNVAEFVMKQGESFEKSLSGQNKAVTVLFSDIRGFTTLSESRTPELLVKQLNEYFDPMVDRILKQEGTLQKFIGDAIMAVWGDTHSRGLSVDAAGAVRAALQMRAALRELNEGWKQAPDRVELSTGIGINHGNVIVGEIGHPQRMEFTVLGDGVNLAARLESSTKQFGCDILVGETAEALTRDEFVFRRVDRAVFKGKTEPIEVFTPLGEAGMEVPAWLGRYHDAVDLYRKKEFVRAKAVFGEVLGDLGGDDYLCKIYQKRCDHFLAEPPAPDWDGSWVLSEK
ncbi:MAG: hypothetical protein RLZZ244_777 [Verrucomicrobiota bacterium]